MKISEIAVKLIDYMGTDLTVCNAARVSFDKESDWDASGAKADYDGVVYQSQARNLKESDAKLISYLAKHNHWSPFAHTSVQLRVKAPLFVSRQLVKHQVGGVWNEVSRRYVDSEPEFWFPEVWRGRPAGSIKQGSGGVVDLTTYKQMNLYSFVLPSDSVAQSLRCYEQLLEAGVAPEQARMILPQNMMTEWYWTGSLMFFCRVCRERLAPGAQQETREVVEQIAEIVAPLFPVAWSALMDSNRELLNA